MSSSGLLPPPASYGHLALAAVWLSCLLAPSAIVPPKGVQYQSTVPWDVSCASCLPSDGLPNVLSPQGGLFFGGGEGGRLKHAVAGNEFQSAKYSTSITK